MCCSWPWATAIVESVQSMTQGCKRLKRLTESVRVCERSEESKRRGSLSREIQMTQGTAPNGPPCDQRMHALRRHFACMAKLRTNGDPLLIPEPGPVKQGCGVTHIGLSPPAIDNP